MGMLRSQSGVIAGMIVITVIVAVLIPMLLYMMRSSLTLQESVKRVASVEMLRAKEHLDVRLVREDYGYAILVRNDGPGRVTLERLILLNMTSGSLLNWTGCGPGLCGLIPFTSLPANPVMNVSGCSVKLVKRGTEECLRANGSLVSLSPGEELVITVPDELASLIMEGNVTVYVETADGVLHKLRVESIAAPQPLSLAAGVPPEALAGVTMTPVPEVKIPPAALVSWVQAPREIPGSEAKRILEELNAMIESVTSEYVQGRLLIPALGVGDGFWFDVPVYIRIYYDGLIVAYTPPYTPESLHQIVCIDGFDGETPRVKLVTRKALELVASKLNFTLENVHYASTLYAQARRLYVFYSPVVTVYHYSYYDYTTPRFRFTLSIPSDVTIYAIDSGLVLMCGLSYFYFWPVEAKLSVDGRELTYIQLRVDETQPVHALYGLDIKRYMEPGLHTFEVYLYTPWNYGCYVKIFQAKFVVLIVAFTS